MLNGKATIILKGYNNSFNSWIDRKVPFGGRVKVQLDLSNYETKAGAAGFDTSDFAKKN